MLETEARKPRFQNWKTISLLVIIIVVATITTALAFSLKGSRIVQTSSLGTYTDPNGVTGNDFHEQFPSPNEATASFDRMFSQSKEYRSYSPCFDDRGNRIGEKATLFLITAASAKTFWRIVWTQRKSESSDIFYIEAGTLDGVLALEKQLSSSDPPRENWRFCKTTKL